MSALEHPAPRMTIDHTSALLALLFALDPRFKVSDETTAAIRVSAWTKLLENVEPEFATEFARRAYSEPRDWPLQPAEILTAWRARREEQQRRDDEVYRQTRPAERQERKAKAWGYIRDVMAAVQRGESYESVPRPEGITVEQTAEQRARERRCQWWSICACDHQHCFAGILDEEVEITNASGGVYSAVKRCPYCADALLMADERGMTKRPTAGGRRR